ncbi:DUF2382 domain-containing protein [Georgenia wutianyii]|uniref:DUF2382 domain-containing protein n=1 Tax=Georgenia wutianyii TaxID=2585135 RepID=A0ABX5VMV5_9MICO|nr:PRC and DUF2382 domain-containing protein [Georgenia wutianyii]QDB78374.1 DUF2382 domain-containing protein [Georgenia wutianyii]
MISTDQIQNLLSTGGTVVTEAGEKIGNVGQVYLDDQTGDPEWVTVRTGMFGSAESFVPLAQGTVSGSEIQVPYGKDQVKDAPRVEESGDGHLSQGQEAELYRYYGLDYSEAASDSGLPGVGAPAPRDDRTGEPGVVGRDTSGRTTDNAMTRSEEQLHVGTEEVQAGKARLRKYIVTENVTTTVPVSHEEVRIEREPITEANRDAAMAGGDLTSEEHEVILHAEEPVVTKETVPVERVRLDTETVTEDREVTEEVRKEQIETDTGEAPERGTKH